MLSECKLQQVGIISLILGVIFLLLGILISPLLFFAVLLQLLVGLILIGFWLKSLINGEKVKLNLLLLGLANLFGVPLIHFLFLIVLTYGGPRFAP